MKRVLLAFLSLLPCVLTGLNLEAADLRHTLGGSSLNSFYTDDAGGSVQNGGSNLSYYFNLNDVNQSAFGTLLLYSKGTGPAVVEDGLVDRDFVNGSGLSLYDLNTTLPGLAVDGEIGLADDSPLTPVSYEGSVSGLKVSQVTYTSSIAGDHFVVQEYRVENPTGSPVSVRLGLANDFDVDQKSIDARVGYVSSPIPFVYQQEAPPVDPTYTTVGVGLIGGALSQHRLEVCSGPNGACAIFGDDNDTIRKAFFEGASGQTGDLTQGIPNQDFAVTLAGDLGTIPPGEGRTLAFCTQAAQGADAAQGLSRLGQLTSACETFYDDNLAVCGNGLANVGEACDDGNSSDQDDCPSGAQGSCQNARCGDGFVWNEESGTEECDDGNSDNTDLCTNACENAVCGDGFPQAGIGEECDDGNGNDNDSCVNCQSARCGDGAVQTGVEVCDDGNNSNGDGCAADCLSIETCGNGAVNPPFENCDDGNGENNDACPDGPGGTCQPAFCGDGNVFDGTGGSEECDDGNNSNGDGCDDSCQAEGGQGGENPPPDGPPPVCGNQVAEVGEQCDGGFGCDANCQFIQVLQGGASQDPNGSFKGCSFHPQSTGGADLGFLLLPFALGILSLRRIQKI